MFSKLKLLFITSCTLLLLGACGFLIPDTPAFQDEFTREFMKSPKEVEDGFYLFESKTGGYTMLFPVDATLDDMYYRREGKFVEFINFGEGNQEMNMSYYVTTRYENRNITENIDVNLYSLSNSIGYTGDYEEFEHNDKTYYYAKNVHEIDENIKRTYYNFFSYVKAKNYPQGIHFFYSVTCLDDDKGCSLNPKKEEEKALKLMKSIEFK